MGLLAAGAILIALKEVFDFEFPALTGFFFALPFGMVLWGLLGIFNFPEPAAFFLGFLLPFVAFYLLYVGLIDAGEFKDRIVGRKGRVSVPLSLEKSGEVVVETEFGKQFLLAKPSEDQLKPLQKGDEVVVVDFVAPFALVQLAEFQNAMDAKMARPITKLSTVIKKLVRRTKLTSQECGICYGKIPKGEVSKCGYCASPFHKDHLSVWLENKPTCPVCRNTLEQEKIIVEA